MNRLRDSGFTAGFAYSQGGLHGTDVIGRGAAASTDQLDTGGNEFSGIAGHVFRRAQVDVASFNRARHTGVGLRGERQGSHGTHALDGVEHGDRSYAAIDAEYVDLPFGQAGGESFRVGAVEAVAVFVNGDMGDDGNLEIYVAAGEHRLMQFFEVAEGFQHKQVN